MSTTKKGPASKGGPSPRKRAPEGEEERALPAKPAAPPPPPAAEAEAAEKEKAGADKADEVATLRKGVEENKALLKQMAGTLASLQGTVAQLVSNLGPAGTNNGQMVLPGTSPAPSSTALTTTPAPPGDRDSGKDSGERKENSGSADDSSTGAKDGKEDSNSKKRRRGKRCINCLYAQVEDDKARHCPGAVQGGFAAKYGKQVCAHPAPPNDWRPPKLPKLDRYSL